jgi:hypothetical protein
VFCRIKITSGCARDNLEGQKSLGPLEMALKVICPQKKISRIFKISGTLIVKTYCLLAKEGGGGHGWYQSIDLAFVYIPTDFLYIFFKEAQSLKLQKLFRVAWIFWAGLNQGASVVKKKQNTGLLHLCIFLNSGWKLKKLKRYTGCEGYCRPFFKMVSCINR